MSRPAATYDTCAACRLPRRLRKDGRVEKHFQPRPSGGNWNWRTDQSRPVCPGAGEKPLTLIRQRSA